MNKYNAEQKIILELNKWLDSIGDKELALRVRYNIVVAGGSIASLLCGEEVNDYDVYIKDRDVLKELTSYYVRSIDTDYKFEVLTEEDKILNCNKSNHRNLTYGNINPGQVKVYIPGGGVYINKNQTDKPYEVRVITPNAITLSNKIQIVLRFSGTPKEIISTFDFAHATNYFTYQDGIVLNNKALECLLTRELIYIGSKYPLTSVIRTKKFIKRGFDIHGGEYLKMMMQISDLNLKDPVVLEDQLVGVDIMIFNQLIRELSELKDVSSSKIIEIIDRLYDNNLNNDDNE